MTWRQALAFQGTVAVVYPETDDPAYRVMFESVIQSLQTVPTAPPTPGGCASEQGFSLHAEVCCAAHQRKKLGSHENLCRLHHPSRHRQRTPDSKPGRTGGAHPEDTLSRWHDPYRDVTARIHAATRCADPPSAVASDPLPWRARTQRQAASRDHSNRAGQRPYPLSGPRRGAPCRSACPLSWARLLKRVFDIDLEHCPRCGGPLKIIAAIEHPPVIAKILTHLGLPARAPPRSPARAFNRTQLA